MFVHSVYFWLKPELTEEERAQFWTGVKSLAAIKSVRQCLIGTPAATDRPVIDRSYSCALIVIFDDEAGHETYQVDPIHDDFRLGCAHLWNNFLIYDAIN